MRRLLLCFVLFVPPYVSGCAERQPGSLKAEIGEGGYVTQPAPIPVTPEQAISDPEVRPAFLERLSLVPAEARVVRARVQSLSARERMLPTSVWPEDGAVIATTVSAVVEEVLCGEPLGRVVDFSYVGGRSGRQSLRTSLMTEDLSPGKEYLLTLTPVSGEYFLVGGRNDVLMLMREESGGYEDLFGNNVTIEAISGACP